MAAPPYSFEPFPVLLTPRLELRELRPTDVTELFAIRSNAVVGAFLSRAPDVDERQSLQFIHNIRQRVQSGESIYWAITLKGEEELIGTICLWNLDRERNCAEIGYELHPDVQGRGLMQEALEAVTGFGFNMMQLATIEACVQAENKRSVKLLERNGFLLSGLLGPEAASGYGENIETLIYTRQSS